MTIANTAITSNSLGTAPNIQTDLPGPKAKIAIDRDHRVTSPSYTRDFPLVVERASGCVVEDVDGNLFLDFAAGIAVCATGHAHPEVVAAIQKQTAELIHICGSDFYYESMIRLCENLCEIAPGDAPKRVFLTNSGTEVVEAAIKLVRYATGRKWLIAFNGAFHGRSMGSLSLTNSKVRQKQRFSPFLPMVAHVPYGDLDALDELFRRQVDPAEVAAIFVEPLQGEGGYVMPPQGFLKSLRSLCDEHGILLVCDEIQSGIGRTGKWFACQHYDIVPDVLCVAKGIASGMPVGALVANESIMQWPPGAHGSTFGGNPVACAAANATIDLVRNGYMENAARMGEILRARLTEMCERHSAISDVRGLGLMVGVSVLDRDGNDSAELRNEIVQKVFYRGMILLGCGETSLRFAPPLCVTEAEIATALDILEAAIGDVG